jgi:hypothetical protein
MLVSVIVLINLLIAMMSGNENWDLPKLLYLFTISHLHSRYLPKDTGTNCLVSYSITSISAEPNFSLHGGCFKANWMFGKIARKENVLKM